MGVLVLNGSPKAGASNTMKLTAAFLEGLGRADVEIINVAGENIKPCTGCYACWEKTPGTCCIADDMHHLLQKYIASDLVIWSFPLYHYGAPSKIKAFMERLLPINMPYIEENNGRPNHPSRYDLSAQKHVLISTCGFFTAEHNYEALVRQFDLLFSGGYAKILCPQGELFRIPQLTGRTDEYLAQVRQAGAEYASQGSFSAATERQLAEPLFPKETFIEMANASWQISDNGGVIDNSKKDSGAIHGSTEALPGAAERLLRQMSAIYSPAGNAPNGEKIIEFCFTDIKETYQLKVKGNSSVFVKDAAGFALYSIRIEVPFVVWQDISAGKLDGREALFKNKYRVLGDFSLMTSLMNGFSVRKQKISQKKRSMLILLLPFLALWILLPLFKNYGAFAAILLSACVPLVTRFFRLSPYDTTGAFLVSLLSVLSLAGITPQIIVTLSYFLFGGLWLASLFYHVPLCAWYSAEGYGGDEAFSNPLFISTNRIIAAVWGVLYLGVGIFTWFLMQSTYASFTGLINSIVPVCAGIFTAVFVKWYPAHFARKEVIIHFLRK